MFAIFVAAQEQSRDPVEREIGRQIHTILQVEDIDPSRITWCMSSPDEEILVAFGERSLRAVRERLLMHPFRYVRFRGHFILHRITIGKYDSTVPCPIELIRALQSEPVYFLRVYVGFRLIRHHPAALGPCLRGLRDVLRQGLRSANTRDVDSATLLLYYLLRKGLECEFRESAFEFFSRLDSLDPDILEWIVDLLTPSRRLFHEFLRRLRNSSPVVSTLAFQAIMSLLRNSGLNYAVARMLRRQWRDERWTPLLHEWLESEARALPMLER